MRRVAYVGIAWLMACTAAIAQSPWTQTCAQLTKPYRYSGIYPAALTALQGLAVTHRIARGMHGDTDADNAHHADAAVEGVQYTGAIDLSVKCLRGAEDIKAFLGALADAGFAAWYRTPGVDGWPAERVQYEPPLPHIHAVWVGDKLKLALRRQVSDWLAGRNGLADGGLYTFWQPSDAQKDAIRTRFDAANREKQEALGRSALAALVVLPRTRRS